MIKLDKYESQIFLLSKGWFREEVLFYGISEVDCVKALWAERCSLDYKYVETKRMIRVLVDLLDRFSFWDKNTITDVLTQTTRLNTDFNSGGYKRVNSIDLDEYVVQNLLNQLSIEDVYEYTDEDSEEKVALVEYYEKFTSFLNVFEVSEDKYGVHVTHCCVDHGCKYGLHNLCPVVTGKIKQEYPCEDCE